MNKVRKYAMIVLGCLIIGITINLFFVNLDLIPAGIFGFSYIYSYNLNMPISLIILIVNGFCLLLGLFVYPSKYLRKGLLAFALIPLFIFLTRNISNYINIKDADYLLLSIYGGVLMGLGFRFIYKEDHLVSGMNIINSLAHSVLGHNNVIVTYGLNLIVVICASAFLGLQNAMYSLISIVIMEILAKRATLGINNSKVFYVITKNENDVKKYIMDELKYDLTEFSVKGGFSKDKNKIIMCVIPTRDYYRLREGIKIIDPSAFISITDSYEVINQDVKINEMNEE